MTFVKMSVLCCLGQLQWSIVSTETWAQDKEHRTQQQPLKRRLRCLQRPPNLITHNSTIAIVSFRSTLATIVRRGRFANYCQHNVHRAESDPETASLGGWDLYRPLVQAEVFLGHTGVTRMSHKSHRVPTRAWRSINVLLWSCLTYFPWYGWDSWVVNVKDHRCIFIRVQSGVSRTELLALCAKYQ